MNYPHQEPGVYTLFYLYDRAKTEMEKMEILQQLQENVFKIKYNHVKPSYIIGSKIKTKQVKTPTVLDNNLIATKNHLNECYKKSQDLRKIKSKNLLHLDILKFSGKMLEQAYNYLTNFQNISLHPDLLKFLQNYVLYWKSLKNNKNRTITLKENLYRNLTLKQLDNLG